MLSGVGVAAPHSARAGSSRFALVAAWALLAMVLAQVALPSGNSLVAALYYVVAGLGWVLPAMPLIAWMVKPDAPTA